MDCCAGNIGNTYITYSLAKELGIDIEKARQIKNIFTFDFNGFEQKLGDVSECTHTILVLQDQIRKSLSYGYKMKYKEIIRLIDYIDRPLLIIGVGTNCFTGCDNNFYKQLDKDLIWFLKELALRCNEIGIRGEFTEDVLRKIGIRNTCVIGCPSYYEKGGGREIIKQRLDCVEDILISGSFYECEYRTNLSCNEVLQDDYAKKYIKLIAFNEIYDDMADDEKTNYINKKYYTFSDIASWKSLIQRHKFVIGYRLHGTIISMNSGIPAICCNNDSRTIEMSNYLKIPRMKQVLWDENALLDYYEHMDVDETNRHYQSLFSRYCDFIQRNVGITKTEIEANINSMDIVQPRLALYKDYSEIRKKISIKVNDNR